MNFVFDVGFGIGAMSRFRFSISTMYVLPTTETRQTDQIAALLDLRLELDAGLDGLDQLLLQHEYSHGYFKIL